MGKSSPDAPDTVGAAREQGEQAIRLNEAQTRANRPNQSNAWGSTNWETAQQWNPITGTYETVWNQVETLNPKMQASLDAQQDIQQGRSELARAQMARVWDDMSNPINFDQYGRPIQMANVEGPQDFNADPNAMRMRAEDAAYQRATNRLDPQFEAAEAKMVNDLRNKGLRPGDAAYDAQVANFNKSRNDAYEQARLGSVGEGRTEAGQLFGQQLQGYQANLGAQGQRFTQAAQQNQIANALRTQGIQEDLARRGFSLQELNNLLAGQQITGGPPSTGGETETYVGNALQGGQS